MIEGWVYWEDGNIVRYENLDKVKELALAIGGNKQDADFAVEQIKMGAGYWAVYDKRSPQEISENAEYLKIINKQVVKVIPENIIKEKLIHDARLKRDKLIAEAQWRINRFRDERDLGLEISDPDILSYVQALRDITKQVNFPESIEWPVLQ